MKHQEIQLDDDTSLLLAAIAEAKDDPLLIAEVAQIDPTEFRKFISECGEIEDKNASQLLRAAESVHPRSIERKKNNHPHITSDNISMKATYTSAIVSKMSPFRLMLILYFGLALSLIYCLLGSTLLWYFRGRSDAQLFFAAFTTSFKTLISLGLILGTALIAYLTQDVIPQTIEAAFRGRLPQDYYYYKRRFASPRISLTFSAEFIVVGFVIFSYCQFPLSRPGEILMLIAACTEYGLGMYVVRKLIYTGMMLHSLLPIPVARNLFRKRELDAISPYVQVVSTLTVIFVCVHIIGYYGGPFLYGSLLGQNIKPFLLLPALMAIFVLLTTTFYPQVILRRIYGQSIDVEVVRLRKALRNENLSAYEKRSYLMEYSKMSHDELQSSLRSLTLEALPTWITILITVLGPLLRR